MTSGFIFGGGQLLGHKKKWELSIIYHKIGRAAKNPSELLGKQVVWGQMTEGHRGQVDLRPAPQRETREPGCPAFSASGMVQRLLGPGMSGSGLRDGSGQLCPLCDGLLLGGEYIVRTPLGA